VGRVLPSPDPRQAFPGPPAFPAITVRLCLVGATLARVPLTDLYYDLHAPIFHLLGIDHTRLTVRHDGINRRSTGVHGHLIEGILT